MTDAKQRIGKAEHPQGTQEGAIETVRQICSCIFMLDIEIEKWAFELNRAQPHRNGRLAIKFTSNKKVRVNGGIQWDPQPVVGKMILMESGVWRFFRLGPKDKYEKLADLRVGKSLKSDPLVVRIINGIEILLKERDALAATINALRLETPNKVRAVRAMCITHGDESADLSERVKLDWSQGAADAEAAIRTQRRERYLAKLAKEGKAPVGGKRKLRRPINP